ncbi:flagellar hook-length control protein FliK [Aeromonas rivipollensis]|uniref:flagellar hook-length control protein FliK n=1 Tax=Aeromonas rivipollensis TaxID=948519 RepID=UPI001F3481C2|nr:flagellar hook-length control protein FliK [Aeromonas rivipollensis]MCE9944646.1 flagellar hook-length control protein FliK [Aeromonas rivipollensis]
MIETKLNLAPSQAIPADGALSPSLLSGGEGKDLSLADGKAAFADAMARAQLLGQEPSASQGGDEAQAAATLDAKSLASAEATGDQELPTKTPSDETELPPEDFLQQLQASLRQDVSLVVPPALPPQEVTATVDGNDLPPESHPVSQAAGPVMAGAAPASPVVADGQGAEALPLENEENGLAAGKVPVAGKGQPSEPQEIEQATAENSTAAPKAGQPTDTVATEPLSGEARAALLAKVVAGEATPAPASQGPVAGGKPSEPVSQDEQISAASATTARAFDAGVVRVEPQGGAQATPEPGSAGGEGDKASPAGDAREAKPSAAPTPRAETTASGTTPQPAPSSPDPVLTAPQQTLARHESQGPQASLTTLSAGIQQMEAEPAVAVGAAAELKPAAQKSRLDELGKQLGVEAKGTEPSEGSQPLQHAQSSDGKPAAEVSARREPQSLPHLKLATPEAPAQLHQKVNLMLADKLQQAEIQLDPLGLGKMKIQIQMDASSQANVHFVVQHGQTREMLEQAMPRLRDMLAGQGIQLGQTVVQQQAQQQGQQQQGQSPSQGQSGFGGQGQQGGGFAGGDQPEGEGRARTLSLLVESTNDAGIDFYA